MLVFVANVIKTRRTGQARGARSVAGRHARVVRNLTSARMELRPHPTDHELAAAARPARAAGGAPMSDGVIGPWARLLAVAAVGGTGARGRLGRGRLGHGAPAARGARAAAARRARRARLDLGAAAAAGRARLARALRPRRAADRPGHPPRGRVARVRRDGAALRADLARAQRPGARDLRDYVTLTKPRVMSLLLLTGGAAAFVGAVGRAGRGASSR